eukprot:4337803-Pyramimonas_sp.AAC.1
MPYCNNAGHRLNNLEHDRAGCICFSIVFEPYIVICVNTHVYIYSARWRSGCESRVCVFGINYVARATTDQQT